MQGDNWVVDALRDWGFRCCGEAGAEIDYPRQANFARSIRDQFRVDDGWMPPMPVTELAEDVDRAVRFVKGRCEKEGEVLKLLYLRKMSERKACKFLGVNNNQLRNLRSTAERTVEMYLTMKCRRTAEDFNPSLLMFA